MITRDEAIEIAKKAVEGTFKPEELARIEVELKNEYIVEFVLIVPPGTLGRGFIRVTIDARSGQVLRRLMDAD